MISLLAAMTTEPAAGLTPVTTTFDSDQPGPDVTPDVPARVGPRLKRNAIELPLAEAGTAYDTRVQALSATAPALVHRVTQVPPAFTQTSTLATSSAATPR